MKVTLVDHTQDAEAKIATYSAICYDADTGPDANARRIKHLLKLGHLATLRFASATFLIEGVSRVTTHQLVRHPHLSYLQQCVTGDTLITVGNGPDGSTKKVPISALYVAQETRPMWKRRIKVYDQDSMAFTISRIKEVFKNGIKPVYEVTVDSKHKIKCTDEHKFLTRDGFTRLKDLNVGDFIAKNGVALHKSFDWMSKAKQESLVAKTGVPGMAEQAGVSYHTIRKWLKIHRLQFSKKETSSMNDVWNKGLKGNELPWYGRKLSTKERIAISERMYGDKNHWWNKGATRDRNLISNKVNNRKLIREQIMSAGICSACTRTNNLQVDHILPVSMFPEFAFNLDNLQILCKPCHSEKSRKESAVARQTVTFKRITKIEFVGMEETYDLEVEHPDHNYVANNLVVHNSQRYVDQSTAEFVLPTSIKTFNNDLANRTTWFLNDARDLYADLIEAGVRKEDARYVLPAAVESRMYITGNFQAWREALTLRRDKAAQHEIRGIANEMWRQLSEVAPNVFPAVAEEL